MHLFLTWLDSSLGVPASVVAITLAALTGVGTVFAMRAQQAEIFHRLKRVEEEQKSLMPRPECNLIVEGFKHQFGKIDADLGEIKADVKELIGRMA